jgi:ADP-heptose:LPS heptosyltransferase
MIKDLTKYYVNQERGYNLGNFIMCTPAINALYQATKTPVKVYFTVAWVKEFFRGIPEIQIIEERNGLVKLFNSSLINKKIYDGIYVYETIAKKTGLYDIGKLPDGLIGKTHALNYKVDVVIISGNGSKSDIEKLKTIPDDVYNHILKRLKEQNLNIYVVGSSADIKSRVSRYDTNGVNIVVDNPTEILSIIKHSKLVIANDTGLYHAASAMKKNMLLLWNQTNFVKNFNPNSIEYTKVLNKDEWISGFDKWIESNIGIFND